MVERLKTVKVAPPAELSKGVIDNPASSADHESLTASVFVENWPPSGWPMFACVTRPSGTVMAKDRNADGTQNLLKYEVRIDDAGVYTIEILKGTLGPNGEVGLLPALSIRFSGREEWYEERPENAVLDLNIEGRSVTPDSGLVLRLILAMTFLISRIDRGMMPNLAKTQKIYRLG